MQEELQRNQAVEAAEAEAAAAQAAAAEAACQPNPVAWEAAAAMEVGMQGVGVACQPSPEAWEAALAAVAVEARTQGAGVALAN